MKTSLTNPSYDCFAIRLKGNGWKCSVTTSKSCEKCAFYKPDKQYREYLEEYHGTPCITTVLKDYEEDFKERETL